MDLSEFSFSRIKNGYKIDVRLFDKKRQALKIGDTIEYTNINNRSEKTDCLVQGIAIFDNFNVLIDCLTPQMLGFKDKNEILLRLSRIYPPEMQTKFNVMAIFVCPKNPPVREIFHENYVNDRERGRSR